MMSNPNSEKLLPNIVGLTQPETKAYRKIAAKLGQIGSHWTVTPKELERWEKLSDKMIKSLEKVT